MSGKALSSLVLTSLVLGNLSSVSLHLYIDANVFENISDLILCGDFNYGEDLSVEDSCLFSQWECTFLSLLFHSIHSGSDALLILSVSNPLTIPACCVLSIDFGYDFILDEFSQT